MKTQGLYKVPEIKSLRRCSEVYMFMYPYIYRMYVTCMMNVCICINSICM